MSDAHRLTLTKSLTIYHALELKPVLVEALEKAATLELDLSQVAEIDSSGVQLLIMIKREAVNLGKQVHLVAHSPVVRETIDFCNLGSFFGDPLLITAQEQA